MASIQELKKKVAIKIKTLELAVRENERILQRNKEKELETLCWCTRRDKKNYAI